MATAASYSACACARVDCSVEAVFCAAAKSAWAASNSALAFSMPFSSLYWSTTACFSCTILSFTETSCIAALYALAASFTAICLESTSALAACSSLFAALLFSLAFSSVASAASFSVFAFSNEAFKSATSPKEASLSCNLFNSSFLEFKFFWA